jgi:hypothetical protein
VGDVSGSTLDQLWLSRANHIQVAYNETPEQYYTRVVSEYEKLRNLSPDTELFLWFEYDLFCQVNMWFCLWLIHTNTATQVYRVTPVTRAADERWKGFGGMHSQELVTCYHSPIPFTEPDITLGANLWLAYQKGDLQQLQKLSESASACFPYLPEVCAAHVERVLNQRPQKALQHIKDKGFTDFVQIFTLFSHTEGVYGFGDSQVKEIYHTLPY